MVCHIKHKNMIIQLSNLTSGTITPVNTQQDVTVIHDAGLTLALTIAFPSNPTDGQVFIISSASGITALNLTSTVGSILSALTGMASGGNGSWMYSKSNNKWYKIR